jgi:hypothetical protein
MVVGLVGSLIKHAPGVGALAAGAATARHAFRRVVSQGRLHDELRGVLQGKNTSIQRVNVWGDNADPSAVHQHQAVTRFLATRNRLDREAIGMSAAQPRQTFSVPSTQMGDVKRAATRQTRHNKDSLISWYHDVQRGNKTYRVFGHNNSARAVFELDQRKNLQRPILYRGVSDHLGESPRKVFKTLDDLSLRNAYQWLRRGRQPLTEDSLLRLAQGGSFTTYGRRRTDELNEWLRPLPPPPESNQT